MLKKIILLSLISFTVYAQEIKLMGVVFDYETGTGLQSANVQIKGTGTGTISDSSGRFSLSGEFRSYDTLVISYIGYKNFLLIIGKMESDFITAGLNRIILPSQTVLVEATVGKRGITPVSFDNITRSRISKEYILQDIPDYLSQLPSTTFYSENGNGIGYNYLSIRGFDQRRISVSINGIPQNDPEDHNVYWLDFPDLLASTELIQVQRGSGSGVIGYPAVGGSINIITSAFSEKPKIDLSLSAGSFSTRKYSAAFASGLIDSKYSIYAKLSRIQSSGYRKKSWSEFDSYHLSMIRYDERLTTQVNFYGGPVSDGLAYNGIAKFAVRSRELRRDNYSYWESDGKKYTYTVERRDEEIENFSQPHFEILNEYKLKENIKINSALFLVLGSGFFDYDGSWSVFYDDYFRLRLNGFDSSKVPENAIIRAQVENRQLGWIPRLSLMHDNGQMIIGAELRIHRSEHWGNINFAANLPEGVTKDYRYYYYQGAKDIVSAYIHETYNPGSNINLLGEIQVAYHRYKLYNEKYLGNSFSIDNIFVNPRVGLNFRLNERQNIFFSYARVTREPRLKNYYDAAESSGGELPNFWITGNGMYDYSAPLVGPETMNDFELGLSSLFGSLSVNLNLYYMLFENEIVKNGKVDRFGQPVTGNVEQTLHTGIELSFTFKPTDQIEIFGNATYSQNKIKKGTHFISSTESVDISDNRISGFPDILSNLGIRYENSGILLKLSSKFSGKFYSDNFDDKLLWYLSLYPDLADYWDNVNESYFVVDFFGSYEFNLFEGIDNSKIFFQVNNILDNLYSAYAIGKEFFPAAGISFIAGIQLGL